MRGLRSRRDSEGAATCRQVLGARCFSTSVLPTQCGREGGRGDTVGREMPSAQQTARTAPFHPSPTPLSAHLAWRNPPSSDCNRPGRLQQPPLEPAPPLTPVPPLTPHTPYPRHSPDSSPRARLQSFSRLVSSPRPTPSPDPGTCSHTGCGTPTATLQGLGLVAGNAERPKRTNRTPSFAAYVEPPDPFRRTPSAGPRGKGSSRRYLQRWLAETPPCCTSFGLFRYLYYIHRYQRDITYVSCGSDGRSSGDVCP